MTAAPLPLYEQLAYTDGHCEAFANALIWWFGPELSLRKLVVADPRYAATLDYPDDARIETHVFCLDRDGLAVDAEGRRPVAEMLLSFGVEPGYSHELLPLSLSVSAASPQMQEAQFRAFFDHAVALIAEHGWDRHPFPAADGSLARNFSQARAMLRERLEEDVSTSPI